MAQQDTLGSRRRPAGRGRRSGGPGRPRWRTPAGSPGASVAPPPRPARPGPRSSGRCAPPPSPGPAGGAAGGAADVVVAGPGQQVPARRAPAPRWRRPRGATSAGPGWCAPTPAAGRLQRQPAAACPGRTRRDQRGRTAGAPRSPAPPHSSPSSSAITGRRGRQRPPVATLPMAASSGHAVVLVLRRGRRELPEGRDERRQNPGPAAGPPPPPGPGGGPPHPGRPPRRRPAAVRPRRHHPERQPGPAGRDGARRRARSERPVIPGRAAPGPRQRRRRPPRRGHGGPGPRRPPGARRGWRGRPARPAPRPGGRGSGAGHRRHLGHRRRYDGHGVAVRGHQAGGVQRAHRFGQAIGRQVGRRPQQLVVEVGAGGQRPEHRARRGSSWSTSAQRGHQ